MKRKLTKKTKRAIFIYIVILLLLFTIVEVLPKVTDIFETTQVLEPGTLTLSYETKGYFVKTEEIGVAADSGEIEYPVTEGTVVKKGNALTTADFARVDRCGWRQTSYVKLHFDEHKAFTSLYFLEAGRSVAQVRQAAQTLLHDAKYGHVLRVKGFIPDGGGWVELNAARDAITVQPIPSGQEVLIVIGEGLDKAAIEAAVRGC